MVKISMAYVIIFFVLGVYMISQNASAKEPKTDVDAPSFNYLEPRKWGALDPRYKVCSTGPEQSPINIDKKDITKKEDMPPLKVVYDITNATLLTNGIIPQMRVKGKSKMTIGGKSFELLGLHWHTPSEHTIDGKRFVAELQQVFVSEQVGHESIDIVIIATVYMVGPPDPIVAAVEPQMAKMAKEMSPVDENKLLIEEVPVDKLAGDLINKIPTSNYIVYRGSLTSPPCTEGVTWFLTDPQSMTLEQANLINELQSKPSKANSRPIQPLNGRLISIRLK